jgi:hypothetical protein
MMRASPLWTFYIPAVFIAATPLRMENFALGMNHPPADSYHPQVRFWPCFGPADFYHPQVRFWHCFGSDDKFCLGDGASPLWTFYIRGVFIAATPLRMENFA